MHLYDLRILAFISYLMFRANGSAEYLKPFDSSFINYSTNSYQSSSALVTHFHYFVPDSFSYRMDKLVNLSSLAEALVVVPIFPSIEVAIKYYHIQSSC